MAIVVIPDIECPLPSALNEHAEAADEYALEWARRVGLVTDVDSYGIGRTRVGHLGSYVHPRASWEALQIAVAWLDWCLVYDDGVVERPDAGSGGPRIPEFQARLLAALANGQPVPGRHHEPLINGLCQILSDTRALRPWWQPGGFVRDLTRFLQANRWEAANTARGQPARLGTYLAMRRHTSCFFPSFRLSAALADVRLAPELAGHVAVEQLETMANNYGSWLNDIFSFPRERAAGNVNNLVWVLHDEQGIGFQQAVDRVADMCRTELASYLELKGRLPGLGLPRDGPLAGYLDVLEGWMRGVLDWQLMTGRYELTAAGTEPGIAGPGPG